MIKFKSTDFTKSNSDKKHNQEVTSTSTNSAIMKLNKNVSGYEHDSKWLVKKNPFTWVVREYVSSKLYQWALGKDEISDTVLVQNNNNKLSIAIKLHDNYKTDFIPFNIHTTKANNFPFVCVVKSCSINSTETSANLSYYNNKPVYGYEKAAIASRLFVEGDADNSNNYALKAYPDSYHVTRYDFDDSLQFFDNFKITKPEISQDTANMLKSIGMSPEDYFSLTSITKFNKLGWYDYFFRSGEIIKNMWEHQKAEKFLNEMEYFMSLNLDEAHAIVIEAFNDVKNTVKEDMLIKHFNFNALKTVMEVEDNKSAAQNLANYVNKVLDERFAQLKTWHLCLKVESSFHDRKTNVFNEILANHTLSELFFTDCHSFYDLLPTSYDKTKPLLQFVLENPFETAYDAINYFNGFENTST